MRQLILVITAALVLSAPAFSQVCGSLAINPSTHKPDCVGTTGPNAFASSVGAVTSLTVTHNLNTLNIVWNCYVTTSGVPVTVTSISAQTVNAVTLNFASTANVQCNVNGTGGTGAVGATGSTGPQGAPGTAGPAGTAATAYTLAVVNQASAAITATTLLANGIVPATATAFCFDSLGQQVACGTPVRDPSTFDWAFSFVPNFTGSIVISGLATGGINPTLSGDVTITGNLNVNGTAAIGQNTTVLSGTYTSGLTGTGNGGDTCTISLTGGAGSGAIVSAVMTGVNTFTGATALVVVNPGTGYTSAPTTGTVTNGTATACAGAPVVLTTIIQNPGAFRFKDRNALHETILGVQATGYTGNLFIPSVAQSGGTQQVLIGDGSNGMVWSTKLLQNVSDGSLIPAAAATSLGVDPNAFQYVKFYGTGTFGSTRFRLMGTPTGNRDITFQDANGTVAFTSQQTKDAFCAGTIPVGASTYYLFPTGAAGAAGCASLTNVIQGLPMPVGCSAQNLQVKTGTGSTGANAVVSLYKNGLGAQILTCTLPAGAGAVCSDTNAAHAVSFVAGDLWAIGIVVGATDGDAGIRASFQCQ